MFAFYGARNPALTLCASAALLGLAGCSSAGTGSYTAENAAVAPQRVSVAQAMDVEDDGLPAQSPPPQHIRSMPDDPSEPYSRNYGGPNPMPARAPESEGAGKTPDQVPVIPHDLPPAFRQKLVTALAQDE